MKTKRKGLKKNTTMSGWFGFGAPWYEGKTDYEIGAAYITKFFNSSKNVSRKISAYTYVMNLRDQLGANAADLQIASLGLGIKLAEMSEGEVNKAADALAAESDGMVPSTVGDFRQALIGQATSTPFVDAVVNSAVVQKLEQVGNTVMTAADTVFSLASSAVEGVSVGAKILSYMPILVPVGVGIVLYKVYGGNKILGMAKQAIGVKE